MARSCTVDGCGRPHRAKGFCLMHYKRARYSPHGVNGRPRGPKPACAHCSAPVIARGLCPRHWKQWRVHGDPLHADRAREARGAERVTRGYAFPRGSLVPTHRALMGAAPGEVVHHVNGAKTDNDRANLFVVESQSAHNALHRSLERAAFAAVRAGVITFDRAAREYRFQDVPRE